MIYSNLVKYFIYELKFALTKPKYTTCSLYSILNINEKFKWLHRMAEMK